MIQKILVSQPKPIVEHNPYSMLETNHGVTCDFHPLIRLEGLSATEFRSQRINPLDYSAVIFNSKLAIEHYFRMMEELRLKVPEDMHYYCVSEQVGTYLTKFILYRKRKVFFGEKNGFEEVIAQMKRRPNETYMMVTSDAFNEETTRIFRDNHIEVQPAMMYRTVANEWPSDKPFDYDMLVLFTPSGVKAIRENFPEWNPGNTVLACFGTSTQEAAAEFGWNVAIKAPAPEFPSITAAIDHYLEHNK